MQSENPLVFEFLKQIQDTSSPERALLPSNEDLEVHTFNHALVAMAFILKNERERAERILNFFADATRRNNDDLTLQNFFYKGEARGFYQHVLLKGENALHTPYPVDRWIGDLAWLLIAYLHYKKVYNSDRYLGITTLLKDLLISFFIEDGNNGGYVQHGWRSNDLKLHEDHGQYEGNIDCYAVFKLCGENDYATMIRNWLERELNGRRDLPLDLYTWRVQAFGPEVGELLEIPESEPGYRKTLEFNRQMVTGFYHGPFEIDNIWVDGVGHMASSYFTAGNVAKGVFYADQLDLLLIDREIGGVKTKALPYAINQKGDYQWVNPSVGALSPVVWYIFAKNGFNPLQLKSYPVK